MRTPPIVPESASGHAASPVAALRSSDETSRRDRRRCCRLARRFASELASADGVEVVNDVVLNQVLVGFGDDARTDNVIDAVQRSGTCWMGGTTWHGRRLMRISVSNWTTTEADVDRSVGGNPRRGQSS